MSHFSAQKQTIKPPQRGIFPLDHAATCKGPMSAYLKCLKQGGKRHSECSEESKEYLKCRMDNGLMKEDEMEDLGYRSGKVEGTEGVRKEAKGFRAGKHIERKKGGGWFGWGGGGDDKDR